MLTRQSIAIVKYILSSSVSILTLIRYYVAPLNSSQPHYLGHAMKFWAQEYNWGPAGYTLSLAAVRILLSKFDTREKCEAGGKYWKNGDWYLGKHLASLGVTVRDTRDHAGKSRSGKTVYSTPSY